MADSERFSSHEMHLFAIYDELRRSSEVKTMLHSDVIKRLNERQDLGDKSEFGQVTGQDIEWVMNNFSALRKCYRSVVLPPAGPVPPLMIQTPPPTARDRECPPAPRPKRKRKAPSSPLSSAMNKMRRNGYTCRARHKGAVPDGNHLLLTKQQQTEWRNTGKTRVLFKGDLNYLKTTLGAKIAVIKVEDTPNCMEICRIADDPDVHIVPFPTLETPTPIQVEDPQEVDYNNVAVSPVEIKKPLESGTPVPASS